MHNSVQMTIFYPNSFSSKEDIFLFPSSFVRKTDEVDHTWGISSRGEFLGVLSSNFSIFRSTRRSPTREYCGAVITFLWLVKV